MFPRHARDYFDRWPIALAATVDDEFLRFMLPRLENLITALERQSDEHGLAVYSRTRMSSSTSRQVASPANAFEADGKLVPARSTVMVAYTAAHYMAEHFEEPDRFDIDRYLAPREEHRKRGAYHPFGIGTHTCLGSRFTEFMMVADLLLLAHHLELEMVPANYRLKLSPLPKFSPDRKFGFRVRRVRNPIPAAS